MRKRLGRAAIAATLLGTLVLPAVGSLADPSKLEQIEAKLARVRGELEVKESKAADVEAVADALYADIVELRAQMAKLDAEIAEIESEVRSLQVRIDATQRKIDKIRNAAIDQAVALYKSGATDIATALLDSTSLAELDSRVAMLGVAAEQNTDFLIRYGRLRVQIEDQERELFNKKEELEARYKAKAKFKATLDERYAEHAAILDKLEDQISDLEHHEGSLETAQALITGRIQELQAKRAAEALGESAQGFIWPLNGPITSYYGERWGRMHTGIDIDGYTGQPVVASKEGRVIMASAYSGYGNTVIIDHGGGIATLYAHLSSFDVSSGQIVARGDVVGRVGCTGSCTGDHLHFEVRVNGNPVNPLDYLP